MVNKLNFLRRTVLPALVLLGLVAYQYYSEHQPPLSSEDVAESGAVEAAYAARRSGVWVETSGRIKRTLPDDNEGSRHQRFILELDSGHTVLVAHNIDLADRVPVSQDDVVKLRGRFESNDRGGVIHWTHHDPDGSGPEGWIRAHGKTYR
ncbi:MAG: DUF3465 domain-containing protein [Gammaproteobacteria bacterium]|nr:DUF3465 domain-containing protein [Gammaproteobacteria bacterium]MDH3560004.1 DUF3465 domain-containing protein [Gammaproteobacteria bacterium]